jgi:hypothetical protein
LVRFIAGDADVAPPFDDPERDDPDRLLAPDADLRAPDVEPDLPDFFAAPLFFADDERFAAPSPLLANIALRAGEARSDLA